MLSPILLDVNGTANKPALQWHFGFLVRDGAKESTMHLKRPAVSGERETASAAAAELRRWIIESPYNRLESAHRRLAQVVENAVEDASLADVSRTARDIQTSVADWLRTFRAFDDQTSHLISREYGKKSHEYVAFKTSLSLEWDINPAYRFATKLRNYSQHVADPVQVIRVSSREGEAGRESEAQLILAFDPARLLREYDEWGSTVRSDLQASTTELGVLPVLASAFLSCERAYASLIDSEKERLCDAVTVIDSFDDGPRNSVPTFFGLRGDPATGEAWGTITLDHVRTDWAAIARRLLETASTILLRPHHAEGTYS